MNKLWLVTNGSADAEQVLEFNSWAAIVRAESSERAKQLYFEKVLPMIDKKWQHLHTQETVVVPLDESGAECIVHLYEGAA